MNYENLFSENNWVIITKASTVFFKIHRFYFPVLFGLSLPTSQNISVLFRQIQILLNQRLKTKPFLDFKISVYYKEFTMLKTRLGSRIKSIIYITVHHAWIDWKVGNFNSFSQVFFMPCFFF